MRNLGLFFLGIYFLFFFSVYQLDKEGLYNFKMSEGIFVFIICYVSPILFFFKSDFSNFKCIKIPCDKWILKLFIIIGIGGLCSIFYYLQASIVGLSGNLGENRSDIYDGSSSLGVGFLALIFSFFSNCYPIHILCFFFGSIVKKSIFSKYKWFFLLASFSYIFRVLAFVGRDGPVFWSFIFFPLLILFKPYLGKKDLKYIKFIITIFIASTVILLSAITISRFGENVSNPLINLYDYFGQSLYNFDALYISFDDFQFGKLNFQIFNYLGFEKLTGQDFFTVMSKFNLIGWVFYGSLGGLFIDFGFLSIFLYLFILPYSLFRISKRRVLNMKILCFLIFIFFLLLHGLFYFNLKSIEGNLFLILLFILSRVNSNKYYIIKNPKYE